MALRSTCVTLLALGLTAPIFGQTTITTDARTATVVVASYDTMPAAGSGNPKGWDYQVASGADAAVIIKQAIDALIAGTS